MARVYGPLHSLEARGGFASQLIFQNQRGKAVVKRWAKPSNPRSPKQIAAREILRFLATQWPIYFSAGPGDWLTVKTAEDLDAYRAYLRLNIQAAHAQRGLSLDATFSASAFPIEDTFIDATLDGDIFNFTIGNDYPWEGWYYAYYRTAKTTFSANEWETPDNILRIVPHYGQTTWTDQLTGFTAEQPNLMVCLGGIDGYQWTLGIIPVLT